MSGSQFRYVRSRAANPSIETLAKISAKLKTPLYELLEYCQLGHRRNLSAKQMTKNLSVIVKKKYADSGLDKEQFAKFIGVSLPQLYLMLRGDSNPSLLIVIEIARRLGVGMWELLGVEPMQVEEPAGSLGRFEGSTNSRVIRALSHGWDKRYVTRSSCPVPTAS